MSTEYITSKAASASWRPKGYGISPGLQRARLRFRLRNMATGMAVASFAIGVWAYSIRAMKQDVFDDVDEDARALNAVAEEADDRFIGRSRSEPSVQTRDDRMEKKKAMSSLEQDANVSDRPRGLVFAAFGDRYPWLFEPLHKTLIWGAPPVDNPGRAQDKVVEVWKR